MDFGVAIHESKSTRAIVVCRGPIDPFIACAGGGRPHRGAACVVDTDAIFVNEYPRLSRSSRSAKFAERFKVMR